MNPADLTGNMIVPQIEYFWLEIFLKCVITPAVQNVNFRR